MIELWGDILIRWVREWEHTVHDWVVIVFVTRTTKTMKYEVHYSLLRLMHNTRFSLTWENATLKWFSLLQVNSLVAHEYAVYMVNIMETSVSSYSNYIQCHITRGYCCLSIWVNRLANVEWTSSLCHQSPWTSLPEK